MPKFATMHDSVKWRRDQTGCELKEAVAWAQSNKALWASDDESEGDEKSSPILLYVAISLVVAGGAAFGVKMISDSVTLACQTQMSHQTQGAKWEQSRLLTLAHKTHECDRLNEAGLASLIQDFNNPK